jgi:hypothetical protein
MIGAGAPKPRIKFVGPEAGVGLHPPSGPIAPGLFYLALNAVYR